MANNASGTGEPPLSIYRIGVGGTPVEAYGDGTFNDPDGVFFDADGVFSGIAGSVLVATGYQPGGKIWRIAPDETISELWSIGSNPNRMALDNNTGRLLIADPTAARVYSADDTSLPVEHITDAGEYYDVDVDPSSPNNIYVRTDADIRVFNPTSGIPIPPPLATGLTSPALTLAFGTGQLGFGTDLYTVSGGELLRFDALSGDSSSIGTGFDRASAIEFGPDGAMYVSMRGDPDPDRVLRIIPVVVPAVGEWGLVAMTLLFLTAGTLLYARRRPAQA